VETSEPVKIKNDTYEEEPDVTPYCHLHWGKNKLGLPNFEQKLAEIAINNSQNIPKEKALNIGCKVGRTSFELAKEFSEVTGLDFSARQLKAGVNMRDNGAIRYTLTEEDQLVSHHEKLLKDFGLQETAARVNFFQGDISNLLSKYTGYNLIVIENALERAYKPKNLLQIIHQRLLPGGVLVIASTYDWQDEFTEKENRLGGYRLDGEPFSSLDAIKEILSANFKLLQSPVELPFLLHQNARRSTYFTSQVTVWQKKN
jgi:putative 4-mercaptohistidine N1-methyltranferase